MVSQNIVASQNNFRYNNSTVKAEEQNKVIQYVHPNIKNAVLWILAKGISLVTIEQTKMKAQFAERLDYVFASCRCLESFSSTSIRNQPRIYEQKRIQIRSLNS